jgi:DNA-directed RNA polymerase subunit RPC12/RpoP
VNQQLGLDRREEMMFRCDNCGSGYSAQAASSWTSCPRCLAKDKLLVPLTFELGWQRQQLKGEAGGRRESASREREAALP